MAFFMVIDFHRVTGQRPQKNFKAASFRKAGRDVLLHRSPIIGRWSMSLLTRNATI